LVAGQKESDSGCGNWHLFRPAASHGGSKTSRFLGVTNGLPRFQTGIIRYCLRLLWSACSTFGLLRRMNEKNDLGFNCTSFTSATKVKGKSKVVSVLNSAPRHEDVWGSEGIVPRIINLGN